MTENTKSVPSTWDLILIPAVLTLGLSILRLVGELQHWSPFLFNPQPGGGAALMGIVWLVPIFGIYFALKLRNKGETPSLGRIFAYLGLGVLIIVGGSFLTSLFFHMGSPGFIVTFQFLAAAAGLVQLCGWSKLARILAAYGLAARIPVIVIMFFAIKGSWGTHYDGPPPGLPEMGWFARFVVIGVLPQILFWVSFTVIVGMLAGTIALAIAGKRAPAIQPAP